MTRFRTPNLHLQETIIMKSNLAKRQHVEPLDASVPAPVSHIHSVDSATTAATPVISRIQLWDLPLRVFHWSLVILVTVAIITGEIGGEWMGIHGKAGIGIAGLVTFRLIWGVIGSTHARFLTFIPTPGKIKAYLQGKWRGVGHNPIGAFSVLALLTLLGVQAGTGLFSNDDIDFTGPLADLIESTLSSRLTGIHQILANVLLGLVALHIIAIGFYVLIKKDNLVKPMVTGWKEHHSTPSDPPISPRTGGSLTAFLIALGGAAVLVYYVSGAARHTTTNAATSEATTASSTDSAPSAQLATPTAKSTTAPATESTSASADKTTQIGTTTSNTTATTATKPPASSTPSW